ncbi:unnamed protein product [Larinioides sclopetarius]|uniref:C2H2-type domain-containing protein n=1 Tax=Larinioides sclopetarius TaxID=280406 RepID=A0AAV1ZQ65_9ARAC
MSDKMHSPSKDIKSFIPYRDKEDQRSNGNGDNSSGDFECSNQATQLIINPNYLCNQEISTEDQGKNRRQKTRVKYPTKKSRILLSWKQDQVECTNIFKKEVVKRSNTNFADSKLPPTSTTTHAQHENRALSCPFEGSPKLIDESKDSEMENSYFNVSDSDLAVAGPSHFTCGICNMSFDYKSLLEDHSKIHSIERSIKFSNSKLHMSKQYANQCQKALSDSVNFVSHQQNRGSASEDRQYKCNLCLKKFKTKPILKRHYKIHTGEKPYICKRCDKRFSLKDNFKRHIKVCGVSHNIGKYECNICHKRYKMKQYLTIHYRIHSGEKPYSCKNCRMCFSSSAGLWQHRKKCVSSSENL